MCLLYVLYIAMLSADSAVFSLTYALNVVWVATHVQTPVVYCREKGGIPNTMPTLAFVLFKGGLWSVACVSVDLCSGIQCVIIEHNEVGRW